MKKLLILAFLFTFCYALNAFAQEVSSEQPNAVETETKTERCYIEIIGQQSNQPGSNVRVYFEVGHILSSRTGFTTADINKALVFNTMIDALNLLSHLGWNLSHTYSTSGRVVTQHWVLYKDVTDINKLFEGIQKK